MDYKEFQNIIKTICSLKKYKTEKSVIYLSGGEPLLHPQFEAILSFAYKYFDRINILSNGILIKDKIEFISNYRLKAGVQISIDGNEEINDSIRGKGHFKKAVEALKLAEEYNIKHWFSYTVSLENMRCYQDVLDLGLQTRCYFNNISPYIGNTNLMIEYTNWINFRKKVLEYAKKISYNDCYAPSCCGFTNHCGAYYLGITVNPDGTITGCARDSIPKSSYINMEKYILNNPMLITETCMKNKWTNIIFGDETSKKDCLYVV